MHSPRHLSGAGRSGALLAGLLEAVASSASAIQQRLETGAVELASSRAHVDVHDIAASVEAVLPHSVHGALTSRRMRRIPHEEFEHCHSRGASSMRWRARHATLVSRSKAQLADDEFSCGRLC